MERTPIDSSVLASVGYDPQARVLEIEMRNGSVYQYYEVPPEIHSGLMEAVPYGRYFNQQVKKYRCKRIN